MSTVRKALSVAAAAALANAVYSKPAQAAITTWQNNATTDWATGSNWSPAMATPADWTTSTVAQFSGTPSVQPLCNHATSGQYTIGGISFTSASWVISDGNASGFRLGGGTGVSNMLSSSGAGVNEIKEAVMRK